MFNGDTGSVIFLLWFIVFFEYEVVCLFQPSLSFLSLFLSLPSSPLPIYSIVLLSSFGGLPSKPTTGSQRDDSAEPVGCG